MNTKEGVENHRKILKFHGNSGSKVSSREGTTLEFKESFNWGAKDEYAKTAAAFSNAKGGYFIFGIKDRPRELVGLQSSNFEELDEARIAEYFNGVLSPEIQFEKGVREIKRKKIGILYIKAAERKPVIAIKNDGREIKEGEIYYRYNARSDKVKYPEMRAILEDVQAQERKYWKNLFERVATIGTENAAIMDVAKGTIEGNGGTVILDEKLLPKLKFIREGSFKEGGAPTLKIVGTVTPVSVIASRGSVRARGSFRITSDPNAPVMRVDETEFMKEFPLDYSALTEELRVRYKDFKIDRKYHRIRKELMQNGLSTTRRLNPKKTDGSKQDFYSLKIVEAFGKFYTKRSLL